MIHEMSPSEIKELIAEVLGEVLGKVQQTKEGEGQAGFLSAVEAAKFLGISLTKLYLLRKEGRLSEHRIGRKLYFEKSALETLIRKGGVL